MPTPEYWLRRFQTKRRVDAMNKVRLAVRRGDLFMDSCAVCGNTKVQAHHDDYDEPLEVTWLCTTHHAELHKERRRAHKAIEVARAKLNDLSTRLAAVKPGGPHVT